MRLQSESARLTTSQADRSSLDDFAGGTTAGDVVGHLYPTPTDCTAQDAGRVFLARFAQPRRSLIANIFCAAVRSGCRDAGRILAWVRSDALRRLASRHLDVDVRASLHELLSALNTPEAAQFAAFILHRESLPADERQRLKNEQAEEYQREWMRSQSPTEKQISFLNALGCRATPSNRAEASAWIDLYKQPGRNALPPPVASMQGDLFERKEVA